VATHRAPSGPRVACPSQPGQPPRRKRLPFSRSAAATALRGGTLAVVSAAVQSCRRFRDPRSPPRAASASLPRPAARSAGWLLHARCVALTRRPSPAQPPKGKAKPAPVPAAAKKPAAAVAPKPSNPLLEEKRPKHFGPSPSRRRAASSETLVLILLLTALPSRHWPGLAAQDAAQPLCEVAEIRPHPAPAPRAHQAPEGACPPAALLLQHAPS